MRSLLSYLYSAYAIAIFLIAVLLLFCPLIILGPTLAIRRAIGRACVRALLLLWGVPLRVSGLAHLPAGPAIVVSNHASYLDGLIMTAALPARYTFVVQDGAGAWPYIGLVLKRMGVTFVNRSAPREGALQTRALIKRLQDGESLTIFAEGTFRPEPGLLPFKNGAFLMAARAGVPVAPAGIRGSRTLLGGGIMRPRWSPVNVDIGEPLRASGVEKTAALALRDQVRMQVLALCGEPDAAPKPNQENDERSET